MSEILGADSTLSNVSSSLTKFNCRVEIDSWKREQVGLSKYFKDATAVISCLGHRELDGSTQSSFRRDSLPMMGISKLSRQWRKQK